MTQQPWFKVWRDKLNGSSRVRRMKPWAFGIYMRLMSHADETGALACSSHVWTIQDIARECECPRAETKLRALLERMTDPDDKEYGGLLRQRFDGAYVVENFARLQRKPARRPSALPGPGSARRRKGLG